MAGTRQPLDLLLSKGNKHFSQAEIEQRRAQEVKAPAPKTLRVPKYLPKGLHKKFRAIGKQLAALNLLSELDYDCLARYLIAEQAYLALTEKVNLAITSGSLAAIEDLSKTQQRYFTQCSRAANDLGLTISSRCKLIVPEPPAPDAPDPLTGD